MNNILTGQLGQARAEKYLKSQGYKIIDTNFRSRLGEIDIIAKEDKQVVFVEVKYRHSGKFGAGFEAVNRKKLNKIKLVANFYLKTQHIDQGCRIDVVSIDGNNLTLFKNV